MTLLAVYGFAGVAATAPSPRLAGLGRLALMTGGIAGSIMQSRLFDWGGQNMMLLCAAFYIAARCDLFYGIAGEGGCGPACRNAHS